MTKSLKVNNAIEAFLILSLSFSLPFISYRLDKISFQTNDDFGIKSFLAGYSIGEPRPQLVRIFEPLDFTLRTLYQMNPNISWYVYLFFLIQALSYSVIASILITKIKKLELTEQAVLVVAFIGITVLFSLVFFYLQYTQVAIIATGIGTVGIIFRTKKTELLVSILILIIGILLRPQAAMPASLIIFIVTFGLLYINEKETFKDLYKRLFLAGSLSLGTFLIYLLSYNSWAPWISEESKELVKRQESVRNIYDYGPFDGVKKLKLAAARDVGFSKNDYELIELYYFADQALFDSEKLNALASEIKDRKDLSVYKKILYEFIFVFLDNNRVYFIFFVGLSALILFKMTPYPIKSLIFTIGVLLSIYFYTLLQGKIPFAVFYATALIALSGILVISVNLKTFSGFHGKGSVKEKIRNLLTLFLITFSIFFGYNVLLLNSDKINQNLYWRSSYFIKASEVDKFKNFEYDKPIVAFSSFYTQLEQTQNPVRVSASDKKIWAQTVDIGWILFEPEYLSHIESLGLSEDLFSSVARGDAYVGTANPFEIQVLSQYLREHRNLKVTWVLVPIADQRSSASGLSIWKVGTARPIRKESN